jgi:hypothetical protein
MLSKPNMTQPGTRGRFLPLWLEPIAGSSERTLKTAAMERRAPRSQQRRPLHPLILAAEPVYKISANVANISSRRSSRHQPIFAHVVPLRQQRRHAARGAGTSRQIHSDLELPVQHTVQLLFLLALLFGIFPQLFSRLIGSLQRFVQSTSLARRKK